MKRACQLSKASQKSFQLTRSILKWWMAGKTTLSWPGAAWTISFTTSSESSSTNQSSTSRVSGPTKLRRGGPWTSTKRWHLFIPSSQSKTSRKLSCIRRRLNLRARTPRALSLMECRRMTLARFPICVPILTEQSMIGQRLSGQWTTRWLVLRPGLTRQFPTTQTSSSRRKLLSLERILM